MLATRFIRFLSISVFAAVPLLSGCELPKKGEDGAQDKEDAAQSKSELKVLQISVKESGLVLKGKGLKQIKQLHIRDGNSQTELKAKNQSDQEMTVTGLATLKLVAGRLYSLVFTTASAQEFLPISIEIPQGSFEPASLKGTGAGIGMVLKWNGSHWVPSPDYVGVGSNSAGILFMGFTQAYNAVLGGLKGANEKCDQEYPGSHWATVDEIIKLGRDYPWTYSVWVREINGRSAYFHETINDRYPAGGRTDNCFDWTRVTTTGGNTITNTNSIFAGSLLGADGQERLDACAALNRLACVK